MSDQEQNPQDDAPFDLEREPLDQPPAFEHDWGGDGSDPLRPVRAHVLAALQPPSGPYPEPVAALATLGDEEAEDVEERRQALGIGQEHVADLARMARDRALYTADSDQPQVWAQNHALRALAELDPAPVVADLLPLLDLEDDFLPTLLEPVFARAGEPAIAPLTAYLADRSRWAWGHSFASSALQEIAKAHPELRGQVVAALSAVLEAAEDYAEPAVTGAMDSLVDLEAVEALPLIRRAFELDKVDPMMRGPWGEILADLGREPDPDDPLVERSQRRYEEEREKYKRADIAPELRRAVAAQQAERAQAQARVAAQKRKQDQARKAKNKRKAASAARKANRKKRK
ncbi:MAG TPA: hypothetical protein PKD53_13710 [Chloroflexaceae bacterium]|nr:hypothetical protein [Chloroflexaceae bacterium]